MLNLNLGLGSRSSSGGANVVYEGLLTSSSSDGSGYVHYRKTGTAGFFVHVLLADADIFRITLFPGTDYLYTIEAKISGEWWKLNRDDDTGSGASSGYYYLVSKSASNINTVWFELQGGDTLSSFQILDEETFNIVGNEFFSPNYWSTYDKVKNPITFGIVTTAIDSNGDDALDSNNDTGEAG